MRRYIVLLFVFAGLMTFPGIALARELTVPKAEDFFDDTTHQPTQYAFVENPDGTYTEYYQLKPGDMENLVKGGTYSGEAIAEGDKIAAEAAVDSGTTGQDGGVVEGAEAITKHGAEDVVD